MSQKIMLFSGFLGSGKTTTMIKTAQYLRNKGISVAVITNDLGSNLVDTNFAIMENIPVMEIPGGCLCHNVENFTQVIDKLTTFYHPDIIFAEPVGSCVDLVRSVYTELNEKFSSKYSLLPFVAVVDPIRYASIYMYPENNSFNDEATYMYKKQLEDADLIVLNKIDLIEDETREQVLASLKENFPSAEIKNISAVNSENLQEWTQGFLNGQKARLRKLDIDWDYIVSGDEHMGWYNSTVKLVSVKQYNYDDIVLEYMQNIQKKFRDENLEIAHLKIMCVSEDGYNKVALTSTNGEILFSNRLNRVSCCTTMNINIRAISKPEIMAEIMDGTLKEIAKMHAMRCKNTQEQAFNSFCEAPKPTPIV